MIYYTIDIETKGLAINDSITYVGVRTDSDSRLVSAMYNIYNFSVGHDVDNCVRLLEEIASSVKLKLAKTILANGKFDAVRLLFQYGIDLPVSHDINLITYIMASATELKEHQGKWIGLKYTAMRELGVADWDIDLKDKTNTSEITEAYLKKDLRYTFEVFQHYMIKKRMTDQQRKIYTLLLFVSRDYAKMEARGVPFDSTEARGLLARLQRDEKQQLDALTKEYDINYNSPKQLADVLYNQIGLPMLKKTKKGEPSTDASTLKKLKSMHPLPFKILEYKLVAKKVTFIKDWLEKQIASRIYPNFNLINTVTGRTSCNYPNLQQVPRAKELKKLFTTSSISDYALVQFDYSQAELRFMGIIANVKAMKDAYLKDSDLHTEMAKDITGKEEKDITKDERTAAKAVNFGYIYGMGSESFVDYAFSTFGLVVTPEEAALQRRAFFNKYPEVAIYHKEVENQLSRSFKVSNLFGREYRIDPKVLRTKKTYGEYLRSAINSRVQSTASDYALMALIEIGRDIHESEVAPVLTVHDSVICLVKRSDGHDKLLDRIERVIKIMEKPKLVDKLLLPGVILDIPIKVDAEIGPWGSAVDYKKYVPEGDGIIWNIRSTATQE